MSHLSRERHPQQDFFVADILDAAPKEDLADEEAARVVALIEKLRRQGRKGSGE